jgi:hypothetical protein
MVERWADWATEIVETWPDDVAAAHPDRKALEVQATITKAHEQKT